MAARAFPTFAVYVAAAVAAGIGLAQPVDQSAATTDPVDAQTARSIDGLEFTSTGTVAAGSRIALLRDPPLDDRNARCFGD